MDENSNAVLPPRIRRICSKPNKQAERSTAQSESHWHATLQKAPTQDIEDAMKIGKHDQVHQDNISESISARPSSIHVNSTQAVNDLQTVSFESSHISPSTPPTVTPVPAYTSLPGSSASTSSLGLKTPSANVTNNTSSSFDYRTGLTHAECLRYDVMAKDPRIAKFTKETVECKGCGSKLQMEKGGKYYIGNFIKHARNCPGIPNVPR
ncbi:hypothetical protein K435DRAFT_860032 [Dendrothele bispora CBS 962.96]|uniref:Uncharacterized protein n=1 Tax=Dendrothele bispora (strain CBS 962.96) TaxID=1314807 RepID=A0A4S8M065_DENBC|nr:hypothetical protein K435DRAFT_860032 [Dendrothele bispora CBS 962.96]